MEINGKQRKWKYWVAGIVLFIANTLLGLTLWLLDAYADVCVDQFLYQMKASVEGSDAAIVWSGVLRIGGTAFLFTGAEILLYLLLSGRIIGKNARYRRTKCCGFFIRHALPMSFAVLIVTFNVFMCRIGVYSYLHSIAQKSTFIEEEYVDPADVELQFPERKRNLVYIYLESMENVYGDPGAGDMITENFIPELTSLAEENVNFSHTKGLGGPLRYEGTTWTAASMVAQTSGVTMKIPLFFSRFGGSNSFLPGIRTLGDILEDEGYRQVLLLGSDAHFANRDDYYKAHGHFEIIDTEALKKDGRIPSDYAEGWGIEDEKLFSFAKEELTRLASAGEPFSFTTLTADTHGPDGYVCDLCEDRYKEQYANVIACSSRQVAEFVNWIKEQSFYENTTIIICGDHMTMAPGFLDALDSDYERTTYNCIINPAKKPSREKERQYGSFDMFPTTLSAMGVTIPGDRLGLGTDLFSDTPTLTEKTGHDRIDKELQKHSDFYFDKFYHK